MKPNLLSRGHELTSERVHPDCSAHLLELGAEVGIAANVALVFTSELLEIRAEGIELLGQLKQGVSTDIDHQTSCHTDSLHK